MHKLNTFWQMEILFPARIYIRTPSFYIYVNELQKVQIFLLFK